MMVDGGLGWFDSNGDCEMETGSDGGWLGAGEGIGRQASATEEVSACESENEKRESWDE